MYQYSHIQVYLVTGGWDNSGLSSTETLVERDGAWISAGELPVAMDGLKGVSLNNNIFMTGNIIVHKLLVKKTPDITGGSDGSSYRDSVLRFKPDDGTWDEVGKMQHGRVNHGASLVNVDDVINYCQ